MGFSSHIWSTGDTSASIVVTQPGTYWVQVTDLNGCLLTDSIVVSVIASDQNLLALSLQVRPVPTQDRFLLQISLPYDAALTCMIVDQLGRCVWRCAPQPGREFGLEIPVSHWASGIYFLHVMGTHGSVIRKLEVQH
jgi:hypothetical protein